MLSKIAKDFIAQLSIKAVEKHDEKNFFKYAFAEVKTLSKYTGIDLKVCNQYFKAKIL